ncbi:MAG: hypothetical protein Q7R47_02195, partial [Candidatus Diapherotrites archaeon]|nr:hypothetical protein [Candidatus Diapherotrites archaeon]
MENTRRLLVLLILTSVLLAGCVKIDLGFKVGAKGRGDASVALDFSRMAESSQQKGSSATGLGLSLDSLKKDKICGTLSDSNSGSGASTSVALGGGLSLSDAKCTATADYKARFDWKNVDLVDANLVKVQTEKGLKIYTFELKNAHAMDSITQSNAQLSNPLLLKAAGFGFSVFVEMPGSVESASAGSISWDRKSVSVDLVDNPDALSKGIRIVSTDAPQTPWLLIGVLIILTLLVGGAVYWFGIKKNPIPFLDARVRPSPPQAAAVPEQQAGEPERFSAPRDFDSFAQPEFAPTRTEGLSPAGGFSFSFDGLIETLRDAYFAVEDRYYELLDRVDARVPVYSVIDPIDQYVPSMVLLLAIGLLLLGGIGWLALGSNGGGIAGRSAVHDVMIGTPAAHLADNSASTGGPRNRDGSSTTPPRPATELGEIKVFTLQFKDSTTKKLLENRTVSFSATCTPGNTALDPRDSTTGSMTIRVPQTCGVLNMVINANDFEPYFESLKFKDLNFSTKVVFLHPLPPAPKTRFTVKVTAVDGANHPVKNVTVRIFKKASADSDLLAVADEGVSQEDGVVALLVSVGGFVVTGFDALTGRFGVTAIQVSADQELRLELNEQGDKKALFVRVVNANTQSGVSDATLRFFLGNTLLTTGTTNAKGEFLQEVVVPTNAGTLRVVVIKPDFVTKIASASFVNIQKPQPVVITLVALTPTNAGKIRVHAFDQTTELSLPDTSVNVFSIQYRIPIIAAPVKTDMDGNALFERLPAASYDVLFAHDGFVDARAAGAAVVGGKTAFVVQGLGHGNGKIRVDVVDSESRSAVDGADVNAYNANSGKLLAGPFQTNAGIVLFEGLDVTVPVYFRVAKSGFVTHTTVYYNALLNGTKSVKVKLTPLSSAVLGLQTGSVYNADRTGLAPSLEPGKSYWIPFSMVLPHDHTAFSQVQTFVQTDGGTDFRIENVDGALVPVSTRFSSQANADGFADTLATAVPANDEQHRGRQVNQLWGDLDSGEYDFWVKVSLPD